MGTLTRKDMEAVIASGGSVLYNGQTIWQSAGLPSEADLAVGDPAAETVAATNLQAQMAALEAQIAKLSAYAPNATPTPPSDPTLVEVLGQDVVDKLTAAGYGMPADVRAASDAQLLAIPGIGEATVKKIRAAFTGEG